MSQSARPTGYHKRRTTRKPPQDYTVKTVNLTLPKNSAEMPEDEGASRARPSKYRTLSSDEPKTQSFDKIIAERRIMDGDIDEVPYSWHYSIESTNKKAHYDKLVRRVRQEFDESKLLKKNKNL